TRVTRSSSSQLRSPVKPRPWPSRSTTLATHPPVLALGFRPVRARGLGVRCGHGGAVAGPGARAAVAAVAGPGAGARAAVAAVAGPGPCAAGAAGPGALHRAGRRHVKYRPAAIPALLDARDRGTRGLGEAGPDVVTTGAWRRFRRGIAKLWSQVRL